MRAAKDQGFTLLELMVVVLVIALVMAVSYPSLSRASASVSLRTAGRDVLNTFRYAREKAVTEQIGVRVTVDEKEQRLILTDDLGENSRIYPLPRTVKIHRLMLAGSEVANGPMIVRFLPNGSSDNAEVTLRSDAGAYLRILSDPLAGGARMELGQGEKLP
jgi:general secretion pathway protein H